MIVVQIVFFFFVLLHRITCFENNQLIKSSIEMQKKKELSRELFNKAFMHDNFQFGFIPLQFVNQIMAIDNDLITMKTFNKSEILVACAKDHLTISYIEDQIQLDYFNKSYLFDTNTKCFCDKLNEKSYVLGYKEANSDSFFLEILERSQVNNTVSLLQTNSFEIKDIKENLNCLLNEKHIVCLCKKEKELMALTFMLNPFKYKNEKSLGTGIKNQKILNFLNNTMIVFALFSNKFQAKIINFDEENSFINNNDSWINLLKSNKEYSSFDVIQLTNNEMIYAIADNDMFYYGKLLTQYFSTFTSFQLLIPFSNIRHISLNAISSRIVESIVYNGSNEYLYVINYFDCHKNDLIISFITNQQYSLLNLVHQRSNETYELIFPDSKYIYKSVDSIFFEVSNGGVYDYDYIIQRNENSIISYSMLCNITFNVCFDTCNTCYEYGSILDHKCIECKQGFYFIEGNTVKSCYRKPLFGYYKNNEIFKQCDLSCKTCDGNSSNNCLSCQSHLIFSKGERLCKLPCSADTYSYINKNGDYKCTQEKKCPLDYPNFDNETNSCYDQFPSNEFSVINNNIFDTDNSYLNNKNIIGRLLLTCASNEKINVQTGECVSDCSISPNCVTKFEDECLKSGDCEEYKKYYTACDKKYFEEKQDTCVTLCSSGIGDKQNHKCVLSCDKYLNTFDNTCDNDCPLNYFKGMNGSQKQCYKNCGDITQYKNPITRECSSNCSSGQYKLKTTWECVDKCPDSEKFINSDECVSKCPNNRYTDINNNCVNDCKDPYEKKGVICKLKCDDYHYNVSGKIECVATCNKPYRINSTTNECIKEDKCAEYWFYNNTANKCVKECPNKTYALETRTCVNKCSDIDQYEASGTNNFCVKKCYYPLYYDFDENKCVDTCKKYIYAENRTCVLNCNKMDVNLRNNATTMPSECVSSCHPLHYYNKETTTCVKNCSEISKWNKKVTLNSNTTNPSEIKVVPDESEISENICLTNCSSKDVIDLETRSCIGLCPHPLFHNGKECSKKCDNEPFDFIDYDTRVCSFDCKSMDKIQYNNTKDKTKTCVDKCPSIKYYNKEENKCDDECPTKTPLFHPISRTCCKTCSEEKAFTSSDKMKCLLGCPEKEYHVLSTYECVKECPKDTYIDNSTNPKNFSCFTQKECINQEPKPHFTLEVNKELLCLQECRPYRKFGDTQNSECVDKCHPNNINHNLPETNSNDNTHIHSDDHPNNHPDDHPINYYDYKDDVTMICVPNCNPYNDSRYTDDILHSCSDRCNGSYIDVISRKCKQTCTNYGDDETNKCFNDHINETNLNKTDDSSINVCRENQFLFNNITQKICTQTCGKYENYGTDNKCVNKIECKKKTDEVEKTCVDSCPFNLFLDNIDKKSCLSECNNSFGNPENNSCVTSCSGNYPIPGLKICVRNCYPDRFYQNKCQKTCPLSTFYLPEINSCIEKCEIISNVLTCTPLEKCPNNYFFFTNNNKEKECTKNCPKEYPKYNFQTKECYAKCPNDLKDNFNECNKICPEGLYEIKIEEIPENISPPVDTPVDTPADTPPVDTPPVDTPPVDTPPVDTPPVDTPPVDTPPVDTPPVDTPPVDTPPVDTKDNNLACIYQCPENTYIKGIRCVKSCNENDFIYQKRCLEGCTNNYISDGKECVAKCDNKKKIYNRTCVVDCPEKYIAYKDECIPCVLKINTQDCDDNPCSMGFYKYHDNCPDHASCNSTKNVYYNMSCEDNCGNEKTDQVARKCVKKCPEKYQYVESQSTCNKDCPNKLIRDTVNCSNSTDKNCESNICVFQCKDDAFVNNTNKTQPQCLTECPTTKYVDKIDRYCLTDCITNANQFRYNDGSPNILCIDQCGTMFVDNITRPGEPECFVHCPISPRKLVGDTTNTKKLCIKKCPSPSLRLYYSIDVLNITKENNRSICVNDCSDYDQYNDNETVIEGKEFKCYKTCPNEKYNYNKRTLIKNEYDEFQNVTKKYCRGKCDKDMVIDLEKGNKICSDECAPGKYIIQDNSTCVTRCFKGVKEDENPIDNKKPLYYEYDKKMTCLMSCPFDTVDDPRSKKCEDLMECFNNRKKVEDTRFPDHVKKVYDIPHIVENGDMTIEFINTKQQSVNSTNIVSKLDYSECEKILRTQYFIPDSDSLLLIKLDTRDKYTLTKKVEFTFFWINSTNKAIELDLKFCDNNEIMIDVPISYPDDKIFNSARKYYDMGIDIHDLNDTFFNDICFTYVSEEGYDIPLQERIDFIYDNISLCQKGCEYNKANYTDNMIKCLCIPSLQVPKTDTDIDETLPDGSGSGSALQDTFDNLSKQFLDVFTKSNFILVQCYKSAFDLSILKKNWGFYVSISLLGVDAIFLTLFFYNFITPIKDYLLQEYPDIDLNPPVEIAEEVSVNEQNKKVLVNESDSPKKKISKNETMSNFLQGFSLGPKSLASSSRGLRSNPPIKINKSKDKNEDELYHTMNSLKPSEPVNKKYSSLTPIIITDKPNMISDKPIASSNKPDLLQDKPEACLLDNPTDCLYSPEELDKLTLKEALIHDKRSIFVLYYQYLTKLHTLFYTFGDNPKRLKYVQYIHFIFNLMLDISFTALFYTSGYITNTNQNFGRPDFGYNFPMSIFAYLVGGLLNIFLNILIMSHTSIDRIKNQPSDKDKAKAINLFLKSFKARMIIYSIIHLLLFIFLGYFIISFCAVFINTQLPWLLCSLMTIALTMVVPFITSLIFAGIRALGLGLNNELLYKISEIISYII